MSRRKRVNHQLAQDIWMAFMKGLPLDYWLEQDDEELSQYAESFPLAKKALEIKATKLHKVLK